ncbi:MAG: CD225/dispanin family protein [Candidatus Xenobium sp.]|jgi:hypothetical protein|nr:hypothetical protein [Burkholderiales bacterium]
MAFCIHCGAGVAEDATFCHSCGGSVQDLSAPAVEETGTPSTPLEEGPSWPASLEMPATSWEAPIAQAPASSWTQPEAEAVPAEGVPETRDAAPQASAMASGVTPIEGGSAWGGAPQPQPGSWSPPGQSPAPPPPNWSAPPAAAPVAPQPRFSDPSGTGWPPSLGASAAPQPPPPPPAQTQAPGSPVPNYLIPAVFSMLCCCLPFGVVSLVFAIQANTKAGAGLHEEAMRNANMAKIWLLVAIGVGLLGNGLVLLMQVLAVVANS